MGLARMDVLLVAAVIALPSFWSAFAGTESLETALIRYVIALPICAVALGLVRKLFQTYALQAVASEVQGKAAEQAAGDREAG